ncbi:hypothetical protein ACHQJC_17215 [Raoultella planticola]|uniref:hypothetical protein n=1 Tax=Raoultella planticola TaxID=575 RepID=UPI00388E5A25
MNTNDHKKDALKYLASEFQIDEQSRFKKVKPTKQLIQDIADAIIYLKQEKQYSGEKKEWGIINSLNGLAVLAILIFILSINRSGDSEYIGKWKFYAYIVSVSFTTIWIGVNIERIFLVRELWKFGITKVMVSLAFTALLIFSTAIASSTINNIFGIDSSYFPFTRGFLTAYVFFTHASQLVYLLLFTALLNFLPIGLYFKEWWGGNSDEKFPWGSLCFIVLTLVFTYFSIRWVGDNFNEGILNEKVYILAHQLDFNDNNLCINLRDKNASVIFLGAEQKQVLVDFNNVKLGSISRFVEGGRSFNLEMKDLQVMSCLY